MNDEPNDPLLVENEDPLDETLGDILDSLTDLYDSLERAGSLTDSLPMARRFAAWRIVTEEGIGTHVKRYRNSRRGDQ